MNCDEKDGGKEMTAEKMWELSGLTGEYEAWCFGGDPNGLAQLVKDGIKTATCSAYLWYELEGEKIPKVGEYNIILDEDENAVCITKTTKVYRTLFKDVTREHAYKEGEGDRSYEYWKKVHVAFFGEELKEIGKPFDENLELLCEEFEVVYKEKED
jgi:uncharacterized protein YhfF